MSDKSNEQFAELSNELVGTINGKTENDLLDQLSVEELVDFEMHLRWTISFAKQNCKTLEDYLAQNARKCLEYETLRAEQEVYFPVSGELQP